MTLIHIYHQLLRLSSKLSLLLENSEYSSKEDIVNALNNDIYPLLLNIIDYIKLKGVGRHGRSSR